MFDFPSSPTEDQVYDAPNGPRYIYKAPAWRVNPLPAAPSADGKTYALRNAIWVDQGWRIIADLKPLAQIANVEFVIPADITMMKITGMLLPTTFSAQAGLRFSSDNGSTYSAGATDYSIGYVTHSVGTLSAGAINSTYLTITGSADTGSKLAKIVSTTVVFGVVGVTNAVYRTHSDQWTSAGSTSTQIYSGSWNVAGAPRPTNGRIVMSSGNINVGTRLIVEGV